MEQKRSGQFKKAQKRGFKVSGLTREQSMKQTTLKGKKLSAAQLRKANELKDIGTTTFTKGKGVTGPGGKAFTGSVTLASGKTASYFQGRRIGLKAGGAKPKTQKTGPSRTNTDTSSPPSTFKRGARAVSKRQDRAASARGGMKPKGSGPTSGGVTKGPIRGGNRPSSSVTSAKPSSGKSSGNFLTWGPSEWGNWFSSGSNRPKKTGGPWSGKQWK